MEMIQESPLIVTVALDTPTQKRFNALREKHFPPAINFLDAHLTLFHALPGEQTAVVTQVLQKAALRNVMDLRVTALRHLGRGVAYTIESAELKALRQSIAQAFKLLLTPQDAQSFAPHITVQNKVLPTVSRALFDSLRSTFQPFQCRGESLTLWRYAGGPWDWIEDFALINPSV